MSAESHVRDDRNVFSWGSDHDVQCAIRTSAPVLISGASAADRESLARWIHAEGDRFQQEFEKTECGSLRALDLEVALARRFHGTTYLDHVDKLSATMQALLARRLAQTEGSRIIAGTGADLAAATRAGTFSATLFYRLNVVHLVMTQSLPEPPQEKSVSA